ncbi:MAG: response regulator transcription factor [Dehalococcoidia bacterium]
MTGNLPTAVLVVDDDPDHAQIAALVLHALAPGLEVRLCRDAAGAVLALDDEPRGALVLIDRMLAGVESFDTVVRMHALRPDVTIVMLSAALSSIDRAYALACGARDALEKPAGLAAWRDAFSVLLGLTEAPERHAPRAA